MVVGPVISGVTIEASESELATGLLKYFVNAAKRLERKVNGKYVDCRSVLLFFHTNVVPESVTFGYRHFRISRIIHRRCGVIFVISTVT